MNSTYIETPEQARRLMTALDAPEDIGAVIEQFVAGDDALAQQHEAELKRAWWIITALAAMVLCLLGYIILGVKLSMLVAFIIGCALIYMAMKGREVTGDDKIAETIR